MWRKAMRSLLQCQARIKGIGASAKKSAEKVGPLPNVMFNASANEHDTYELRSKSGKITAVLSKKGSLCYSVFFNGKCVIDNALMGIVVKGVNIGDNVLVGVPYEAEFYEEYKDRGHDNLAIDEHMAYVFPVRHTPSGLEYNIEIRIWNDGFGFRFIFRKGTRLLINDETSTFNMPVNSVCWYQKDFVKLQGKTFRQESRYLPRNESFACLTAFELENENGFIVLTESNLNNYPGAALKSQGKGSFKIDFWDSGDFYINGGKSPWRLAIICETLNGLVNSKVIKNSSEPELEMFKDENWIVPGKSAWSYFTDKAVSRNFETIMRFNDYAHEMGYEYNLVDSGWRSLSFTETGAFNKVRDIVTDAKKKNVGIFVWKAVPRGLYFSLYRKLFFWNCRRTGIKGVKFDHIESETQFQINLYRKILEEAAKSKLMVLYHNPQKPTGLSRTYPNLMSMEAIRGLQCGCDTDDDAVLPFIRSVAGDAEYTPLCFTEDSYRNEASVPHMLASAVIYMSSFLTASGDPRLMSKHIACDFIRELPTVWDKTIVLPQSRMGDVAVFARKKGNDWYIAAHNSNKIEREITITLDFLREGDNLDMELFIDDLENPLETVKRTKKVKYDDKVIIKMRRGGGFAGVLKNI